MRSARHIGKNVLVMPPMAGGRLRPDRHVPGHRRTGGHRHRSGQVAVRPWGGRDSSEWAQGLPTPPPGEQIEALRAAGRRRSGGVGRRHPGFEAVDEMLARLEAEAPPLAGRHPQRGSALRRRPGEPDLGPFRAGAVAQGPGSMAPAPGHRPTATWTCSSCSAASPGSWASRARPITPRPTPSWTSWLHTAGPWGSPARPSPGAPGLNWEKPRSRENGSSGNSKHQGTGWISPQQGLDAFDELVRRDLTSSHGGSGGLGGLHRQLRRPPPTSSRTSSREAWGPRRMRGTSHPVKPMCSRN